MASETHFVGNQCATVPRKRRPRAVGEVSITCPSSTILLNTESPKTDKSIQPNEPVYENTIKEPKSESDIPDDDTNEVEYRNSQQVINEVSNEKKPTSTSKTTTRKSLTFIRATISDIDETKESMIVSTFVDDSDHYYESLSPLNTKSHSVSEVQYGSKELQQSGKLGTSRYSTDLRASQRSRRNGGGSSHVLGEHVSDPYDSFDTDTDEVYEAEENMKNHNDSGVEICNTKLPDPPSSSKQTLGFKKKIQNFISKISPSSSSNKQGSSSNSSQGKLYESSQFFVESNVYENTPKAKSKNTKSLKKSKATDQMPSGSKASSQNNDAYENTKFPVQRPAPPPPVPPINTTNNDETKLSSNLNKNSLNPSASGSNNENPSSLPPGVPPPIIRPKAKSSKSLRSRIRKSLVGSIDSRSTFYVDPSHQDCGELDSGFSEKASSGDLPTTHSTSTTQTATTSANDALNFCTVRKNKKDSKTSAALMQRRRTTIGIRPHGPPPPPPLNQQSSGKQPAPTTSWYAEYEVFKTANGYGHDEGPLHGNRNSQNGSMNCYAEAGLYQTTSGNSVASSSGSSGVSTGNEGGLGDGENDEDEIHLSMFSNEPLYQIYSAAKLESISRDMEEHDSSTDGYEEIGQSAFANKNSKSNKGNKENHQKRARPTALQLIEPKNGPSRTLWCEISEVINSGILPTLTPRERALQEAKFEIITSEASYIKSLNLLRLHFMNNSSFRDTNILSSKDRRALFSHIIPVHECSERLLTELESCWQDNIMLLGLSKRIYDIAEKHFHVYISFCEHQGRMDRTLRNLKGTKGLFSQHLDTLESSPTCCGLNLHSFLMLPMQRITRLPLLIDAVFSKLNANDDEYENWKLTMAIMNKIVKQCNDAANRCEQAYEIERISKQLEFPPNIRALAIAPFGVPAQGAKPRYFVKRGELTHLIWRGDDAKLTFGKKFTKTLIYAFLFSDLIVLTKRRNEEQFIVFDYCPRNLLTISSGHSLPQLPTKDIGNSGKHLILMTLLENHEGKTVEMVLSCPSISEQERWLQAMRPPEAETPGEKLYESWDCPQVLVKHAYESTEPDVLNLEIGDVINVSRKMPDGWFQGERIRDGAIGWFPGSYTEEVNSPHVRSRNLKQRYRLLTLSGTYLESLKRK